jgi:glycosyltransferase involved in cell wall biosynthesis
MLWPRKLSRQIASIAPDVVHCHSGVWLKAARAARMAGVTRVIHTEHGRQSPDPLSARIVDGLAAGYTDVAVAVSARLGEQLAATVVKRRAAIAVVPNGVDVNRFRPRPDSGRVRGELAIPPDVPILGSIGRLEPIKGYDVMLEALAEMVKAWPSGRALPHLVIAGDGSARPALELRQAELGIADQIHFLGWRDDVDDLLSCFSVFTMSSRSEGTSVGLLEAMSSGLCPVLTRVGGNEAVLGPDLAHRLVPTENPPALAMAWREALTDCEGRTRDGVRARLRIEESFSLEVMVRQYQRLYCAE